MYFLKFSVVLLMLALHYALLILHCNAREQYHLPDMTSALGPRSGRLGFGTLDFRAEGNQDRGAFCSKSSLPHRLVETPLPLNKQAYHLLPSSSYILSSGDTTLSPQATVTPRFLMNIQIPQETGFFQVSAFTTWPWEQNISFICLGLGLLICKMEASASFTRLLSHYTRQKRQCLTQQSAIEMWPIAFESTLNNFPSF